MDNSAVLLALVVMAAVALIVIQRFARQRGAGRGAPASALADGRVIVTGWTVAETRAILDAFAGLYDLDASTFAVSPVGDAAQVTWPRPVATDTALFLVNYLVYPSDPALAGRTAEAVAVIAVPAKIAPEGLAPGTLAKVYVPADDTEHDLVHALTPGGSAYRIGFTDMKWQAVDTPRATPLVAKVAFAVTA